MEASSMDGTEILLWVINVLGVLFGFVASLLIRRLFSDLDSLRLKINGHREEMLKNYPTHEVVQVLRKDFMDRMDLMEHNIKNSVHNAILKAQVEELKLHKKDHP